MIHTDPLLLPRPNQADHEFSIQQIVPNPNNPQQFISQDILNLNCNTLSINQFSPHNQIQCPYVASIEETQEFLQHSLHIIKPDQPTAILTNFNRELGLFVKQTCWSDMSPEEYNDIKFLTSTIVQLGKFYRDQKNGSFLGGIMKAFGWRKGYDEEEHCGMLLNFSSHFDPFF